MTRKSPRRIAAEEAFSLPEQFDAFRRHGALAGADAPFWRLMTEGDNPFVRRVSRQLLDLADERIEIMDSCGVDMHVLALTSPGVQTFPEPEACALARLANDRLAELIVRNPARFAGLATIAPQAPEEAAREIRRAVGELGLNGVMINSHTSDAYLDEPEFLPIFEAAAETGAAVYIHPRAPSSGMAAPFMKYGLETAIWGYGAETGLHGVRLIMSGIFDRFPDLKIVLGHMGEGLPFWLWRLDYMHAHGSNRPKLELRPSDYMRRNIAITTSGMNWPDVLDFCLKAVGEDNIMWAIDYPYQETPGAVRFLDKAPLQPAVREKIYARNAERIFRIAPH
jgi:5-carboxyvanillate decarboxylase